MVKSGRLKRSIRKISSGLNYIIIGSDVPYAKVHNEGGKTQKSIYVSSHTRTRKAGSRKRNAGGDKTIKVKSHTRKMNLHLPKRQFMGKSRALELRLQHHLKKSLTEQINRNI